MVQIVQMMDVSVWGEVGVVSWLVERGVRGRGGRRREGRGGEGRRTVCEVGCVGTEEDAETGAARDEATVWLSAMFALRGIGWFGLHYSVQEGCCQCDPCGNGKIQLPRQR